MGTALAKVSTTDISVVIVTYNCRALVESCIDSLAAEVADVGTDRVEIIVVDNGSNDGTIEALQSHPLGIRLIESDSNTGFAAANNKALQVAKGRFFLLLNPDTVVRPGTLRGALDEISRRPEVGVLGVKLVLPDGSLDHACKRGFPSPAAALGYFLRLDHLMPSGSKLAGYRRGALEPDEEASVDAISGAFMLVRRETVNEVGLLDEGYWMYSEDLDWCARFRRAGWKVLYWPGGEVLHIKGGSGGHRSFRTNLAFHQGMIRFHRLHGRSSWPVNAAVATGVWLRFGLSLGTGMVHRLAEGRLPPFHRSGHTWEI